MLFVVQPVGICKGGAAHSQLLCLLVHQLHEFVRAACHSLRHGHRRVVSGGEHQPVQQGFQRQLLPRFQVHGGTLRVGGLRRDLHGAAQLSVFQRHQRRHNFRRAGNQHFCVFVLGVQHPA
ncbi:hypothetical protein SDC9_94747 [bioreactor metagenome]|uniref:Uncharacterized protein n=1 Tax=bioreactor metagenome TaxID=1076179 RepID=A0A645A514_9ZZZZ